MNYHYICRIRRNNGVFLAKTKYPIIYFYTPERRYQKTAIMYAEYPE